MKHHGFTLIEILVAMSIFGLIVSLASTSFTGVLKQNARLNAQRHLQEDSNYLMEKIVKEVRNGSIDFASHHISKNFVTCAPDQVCYDSYQALPNDVADPASVDLAGERTIYLLSGDGRTRTVLEWQEGAAGSYIWNVNLVRQSLEEKDPMVPSSGNWLCTDTGDYYDAAQADKCKTANALAPENIFVTNLKFIISPVRDPYKFSRVQNLQTQPTITIIMETALNGTFSSDLFPDGPPTLTLQTTVTSRYYGTINWVPTI